MVAQRSGTPAVGATPAFKPTPLTSYHKSGRDHANGIVLIIYTGGTLGMTKDTNTGALSNDPAYLRRCICEMPEFENPDIPDTDMIQYDPLLDSSNVGPSDWSSLADVIGQYYLDYDGFVIVHGTDTMAYTASALSFMLQGLGKPVVVTGSIIPLCEVPARRLHVPEGLHCAAAAPACPVASRAQAAARRAGAPACG